MSLRVGASQRERAQDLQYTFSSVGGGVHLGLLSFKLFDGFTGHLNPILVGLQLLCLLLVFARAYWLYLNVFLFFAPFSSMKVFFLDVVIFLGFGLAILLVGRTRFLFSTAAVTAILMCFRLKHTQRAAASVKQTYPVSYRTFQGSMQRFFRAFAVATSVLTILASSLWLREELATLVSSIFAGTCCVVAFLNVAPLFPVEKND